jgi:hypothetical protein
MKLSAFSCQLCVGSGPLLVAKKSQTPSTKFQTSLWQNPSQVIWNLEFVIWNLELAISDFRIKVANCSRILGTNCQLPAYRPSPMPSIWS